MVKDKREILLRLCRLTIMLLITLVGVFCFFALPDQGLAIFGSSLVISLSYFCVLYHQKNQWLEFLILASVIVVTTIAYFSSLNGFLFLPQIIYLFYGMSRAFIIKELKKAFSNSRWNRKKGNS